MSSRRARRVPPPHLPLLRAMADRIQTLWQFPLRPRVAPMMQASASLRTLRARIGSSLRAHCLAHLVGLLAFTASIPSSFVRPAFHARAAQRLPSPSRPRRVRRASAMTSRRQSSWPIASSCSGARDARGTYAPFSCAAPPPLSGRPDVRHFLFIKMKCCKLACWGQQVLLVGHLSCTW